MARRKLMTEDRIERWFAEGRGQGTRSSYKPGLTVRDVPSHGLSSRLKSIHFDRVIHVFSTLERYVLFHIESLPDVWDIREQYPLNREVTLAIAEELDIRHPYYPQTTIPTVMTTDFLVTFKRGSRKIDVAIAVKYSEQAERPRTKKKLTLERTYWELLSTPVRHLTVTEKDISLTYAQNLQIMRPYRSLAALYPLRQHEVNKIQAMLTPPVLRGQQSLVDICRKVDRTLGHPHGTCLKVSRHLIGNAVWPVDLTAEYIPRLPLKLHAHTEVPLLNKLKAA